MKSLRLKNVNKTIIGQININSISSKFNQLKGLVLKHVDILVVCDIGKGSPENSSEKKDSDLI